MPISPKEEIYLPQEKRYNINDYQDCFMILTVSQSPFVARTYIPRQLHGPDRFTMSTICTYTKRGSREYLVA